MKFTIDVVEFMRHRDTSFEQINFIEKMQPGCFPKKMLSNIHVVVPAAFHIIPQERR